jgi:hypothetical protein
VSKNRGVKSPLVTRSGVYFPGDIITLDLNVDSVKGVHVIRNLNIIPKPFISNSEGEVVWNIKDITHSGDSKIPDKVVWTTYGSPPLFKGKKEKIEKNGQNCGWIKFRLQHSRNLYGRTVEFTLRAEVDYARLLDKKTYLKETNVLDKVLSLKIAPKEVENTLKSLKNNTLLTTLIFVSIFLGLIGLGLISYAEKNF